MRDNSEIESVMEMMDGLMDADSADSTASRQAEIYSDPHLALQRFKQQSAHFTPVRSKQMTTQRKTMLGAVLALAMLIFIASFPATRAWASDMLSIFRVAKFAPISVSPQQLAFLEEIMEDGEGFYPGEFTLLDEPEPGLEFDSRSDALAYLQENEDFYSLRSLDGYGEPQIYIETGGAARLTVDLASARRLLEAADIDPTLLPDSLDGQDVTGQVGVVVMQEFDGVQMAQTEAPEINYPNGVDPQPIGEALLRLLGMDESDAARLSQNIDWGSTLVLPVPAEFATFSEVPIEGTTGLAIEAIDGQGTSLMWQSRGQVYMIASDSADVEEILDIVESLYWFYE